MKQLFKALAALSAGFGILILLATIRNFREDIILEDIAANGTEILGVVDFVDTEKRNEIGVLVDEKSVTMKISASDNYYEVGDTIQLLHYTKYPTRYIFNWENFESIGFLIGGIVGAICLAPLLLLFIRKKISPGANTR